LQINLFPRKENQFQLQHQEDLVKGLDLYIDQLVKYMVEVKKIFFSLTSVDILWKKYLMFSIQSMLAFYGVLFQNNRKISLQRQLY